MSSNDNAAIVQQFNDAYNQQDWDAAVDLVAPNATFMNMATGDTFQGQEGARQFLLVWSTAFPQSQIETTEIIAGDNGAVIEFIGRGEQTGPLESAAGTIEPTGRSVEQRFCSVNRIEDGKITEARLYFDLAGLMQQLGLMPQQSQSPA
jgi:steroid delta-isomerase-like uncharacterized protein